MNSRDLVEKLPLAPPPHVVFTNYWLYTDTDKANKIKIYWIEKDETKLSTFGLRKYKSLLDVERNMSLVIVCFHMHTYPHWCYASGFFCFFFYCPLTHSRTPRNWNSLFVDGLEVLCTTNLAFKSDFLCSALGWTQCPFQPVLFIVEQHSLILSMFLNVRGARLFVIYFVESIKANESFETKNNCVGKKDVTRTWHDIKTVVWVNRKGMNFAICICVIVYVEKYEKNIIGFIELLFWCINFFFIITQKRSATVSTF